MEPHACGSRLYVDTNPTDGARPGQHSPCASMCCRGGSSAGAAVHRQGKQAARRAGEAAALVLQVGIICKGRSSTQRPQRCMSKQPFQMRWSRTAAQRRHGSDTLSVPNAMPCSPSPCVRFVWKGLPTETWCCSQKTCSCPLRGTVCLPRRAPASCGDDKRPGEA